MPFLTSGAFPSLYDHSKIFMSSLAITLVAPSAQMSATHQVPWTFVCPDFKSSLT